MILFGHSLSETATYIEKLSNARHHRCAHKVTTAKFSRMKATLFAVGWMPLLGGAAKKGLTRAKGLDLDR